MLASHVAAVHIIIQIQESSFHFHVKHHQKSWLWSCRGNLTLVQDHSNSHSLQPWWAEIQDEDDDVWFRHCRPTTGATFGTGTRQMTTWKISSVSSQNIWKRSRTFVNSNFWPKSRRFESLSVTIQRKGTNLPSALQHGQQYGWAVTRDRLAFRNHFTI